MTHIVSRADPIVQEMSQLFKYSNAENNHLIYKSRRNDEGDVHIHRIFQNCVSCGKMRFDPFNEFAIIRAERAGTLVSSHFCEACDKKVDEFFKTIKGMPTHHKNMYTKMWDRMLFGPLEGLPQSKL